MTKSEKILQTEFSEQFVNGMKERMVMSFYKYGPVSVNYGQHLVDFRKSIDLRLQKYDETGNLEYLMDVSNLCMIGFMCPQHPNAHYKPTDSKESPGLVGMSINEIKAFQEGEE